MITNNNVLYIRTKFNILTLGRRSRWQIQELSFINYQNYVLFCSNKLLHYSFIVNAIVTCSLRFIYYYFFYCVFRCHLDVIVFFKKYCKWMKQIISKFIILSYLVSESILNYWTQYSGIINLSGASINIKKNNMSIKHALTISLCNYIRDISEYKQMWPNTLYAAKLPCTKTILINI